MAHWLFKSEPTVWSFEMQVAAGEKGTDWTGYATIPPSST